MDINIFTIVGYVMIFLFAGMGIGMLTLWAIEKFITYVLKHLELYKILIDFIYEHKQFKKWKNENSRTN